MKKNYLLLILTVTFIFSGSSFVLADEPTFVILHTNDFHGHLVPYINKSVATPPDKVGGASYLAAVIRQEQKKNKGKTLLIDAGDMFQGTPASNLFYGQPVTEVMNNLGYTACTLGNHEFDWDLSALQKRIIQSNFPWVSSNIIYRSNRQKITNTVPYLIKEVNGVKVGIIGLTTPSAAYISNYQATSKLIFINEVKAVKTYFPVLKNKGAEIIIVLSHLGVEADVELAKNMPQIDIIVGGHSHTVLKTPIIVNKRTIILQTGSYGNYLGKLTAYYDKKVKRIDLTKTKGELIPIINQNIQPDKEIELIIKKYTKQVEKLMSKVVAVTEIDLTIDLTRSYEKDNQESILGAIITDSMREHTKADIAFLTSGGIRGEIHKGSITLGDIYTILPFGGKIVTMDLTGRQVLEIIEKNTVDKAGTMQLSGLTIMYDPAKPVGSRVIKVMVGSQPLDLSKTYRVATNSFLASGGDKLFTFKKGKNLKDHGLDRDILISHLQKLSPIKTPPLLGRIIEKK